MVQCRKTRYFPPTSCVFRVEQHGVLCDSGGAKMKRVTVNFNRFNDEESWDD